MHLENEGQTRKGGIKSPKGKSPKGGILKVESERVKDDS